MEKERNSGIELLRIICIFLLVGTHDNTFKHGETFTQIEYIFKDFIPRLTVNIFIMISALNFRKLNGRGIKLFKKIILYHIIAILMLTTLNVYTYGYIPTNIFREIFNITGYAWAYLIVVIIMDNMKKEIKINSAIILFVLLFLIPYLLWWFELMFLNGLNLRIPSRVISYNGSLIFCLIIIGVPIIEKIKILSFKKISIYLASIVILKLSLDIISFNFFGTTNDHRGYTQIFNIIMPILIVLLFYKLKFKSRLINKIASATFLAYFIESTGGLGWFLRINIFTGFSNHDYFFGIIVKFIIIMIVALIIEEIIKAVSKKIK